MMNDSENKSRDILPIYEVTARVLGKKSIAHQEIIRGYKVRSIIQVNTEVSQRIPCNKPRNLFHTRY